MTAAMDSPDRNPIMPTSDIQGSPFFNFLCSLSPIKQVKLGHGAQTFSELSFPPPPAIFVSPKVENQRNSAPSKRRLLTGATHNAKDKSECDVESSNVEKNSLSWRQATGGCQQIAVTAGTHSIIPCEAALAAEATQVPNDGSSKPEMKVSQCSSGEGSAGIIMLPYDNAREAEGSFEPTHTQHLAFNGNHVKMLDQCAPSLLCETVLDKHKDPSYLSSNDLEKMAASWSLPVEYLSKILASINGTADVVNQTASFESDFPRVNNEPSNLQTAEVVKSEDVDHDCKGTTTGVRRRCLDFETLETQQRALDDLPTLKMLDLSSDNLPCGGFSSNPTAKNKEPASCENNALQYNSIESQNSSAWDHGMHTFSNLNILPQYKRMPDPSIAAYLPLQQSAITNSQVSAPGLSLQVKPTCIGMLNTGLGCSLPGMTSYRPDIIGASGGPPYSARLLPLSGLQVSSSENEQNLLQSTDYTQTEYSGNLDQELLLSLVKRTRMLQHDLLLANSAARLRMAMPTIFYPSFGVGMNPIEETKFSNELESKPTSIMDNSVTHQENSHQSESDHQEDSTLSPRSPPKKRKLLTQTGDSTGEGCKNCKCKKSKCLKLYCECFAAGVYCIDICNCHDCFNKPEFEETVLGTRQQIESRNPLAFLPKIIRASEASPTLGEESMDTPASARHKRGCNCKKSQCLKKYCECYQAGVGCADGCRCEGCKNIYGRNEGTGELEDKDQQNAASEMKITTNDEPTEMDLKHSNEHSNDLQSRDLGPITPYLDNSGQCRSDGELGSAKRLTSPLEHPASTLSLHSPSRLLELLEETENFGQVNLQSYQTASANIVPNHQFSPGWDGQSEIFTPTRPLQQLAPVLSDALLLNKGDAGHPQWQTHNTSSNISSYMSGLTNPDTTQSSLVHQQMVPLNFSPDTNQFETPENGLTVPVTPLPSTSYASRPNYDYEELSEPRPHQSVWFTDDDDSPNVLRELNTFCAPNIITKTRSPQQKRIFSYQRGTGLRNNLSPGLVSRNGRKFILHALPSSGYSEKSRDSE